MFYYLLDTAICNAYILSKHYCKSQSAKKVCGTHCAFREALIKELLVQYKIQPTRKYLTRRHLPTCKLDRLESLHKKTTTSYCRECYFCRFQKNLLKKHLEIIRRIGLDKNIQQTKAIYKHCQVYLYTKCFTLFHSFEVLQ
jgi:hypothetical protein